MTLDRCIDEILVVKRVHDQQLLCSEGARSGFKPIRQPSTSKVTAERHWPGSAIGIRTRLPPYFMVSQGQFSATADSTC